MARCSANKTNRRCGLQAFLLVVFDFSKTASRLSSRFSGTVASTARGRDLPEADHQPHIILATFISKRLKSALRSCRRQAGTWRPAVHRRLRRLSRPQQMSASEEAEPCAVGSAWRSERRIRSRCQPARYRWFPGRDVKQPCEYRTRVRYEMMSLARPVDASDTGAGKPAARSLRGLVHED
jgi:hypothetical protein